MCVCVLGVPLRSKGQYLSLEVPGLTEGRPSLLIGDRVIASVAREDEEEDEGEGERYWEGCIHQVCVCMCKPLKKSSLCVCGVCGEGVMSQEYLSSGREGSRSSDVCWRVPSKLPRPQV